MKYEKIDMNGYNLHMIKIDKFKTINVRIAFKRKIKKEEINYRNLLSDILLESSQNYPSRRDLQIAKGDLYDISTYSASFKSGLYTILTYSLTFLNERYTEEGMNEAAINFLFDLLLNPHVEDGKFNSKSFEFVKESLKNYLISIDENPDAVAISRLYEEMGGDTSLGYKASGYLDTLDEIDAKKLYDYYKSIIQDDIIDIFIIGNIDEEKTKEIFSKIKIRENKNTTSESHFVKLEETRQIKEIVENKGFVQSKLQMGFKIDDMTDFEKKYVLHAYSFILGGGNDSKLFREVREKNSLCYYISSSYSILYDILTIESGINKNDYEKTVELVKKAIEEMKNGDFKEEDLEEVKIIYQNACRRLNDNPMDIIQNYLTHEYFGYDLIDKRIEEIKKVTKEDIIALAKKVKLDTIYLLEGGNDEEGSI